MGLITRSRISEKLICAQLTWIWENTYDTQKRIKESYYATQPPDLNTKLYKFMFFDLKLSIRINKAKEHTRNEQKYTGL